LEAVFVLMLSTACARVCASGVHGELKGGTGLSTASDANGRDETREPDDRALRRIAGGGRGTHHCALFPLTTERHFCILLDHITKECRAFVLSTSLKPTATYSWTDSTQCHTSQGCTEVTVLFGPSRSRVWRLPPSSSPLEFCHSFSGSSRQEFLDFSSKSSSFLTFFNAFYLLVKKEKKRFKPVGGGRGEPVGGGRGEGQSADRLRSGGFKGNAGKGRDGGGGGGGKRGGGSKGSGRGGKRR
jgi:hypothetical protein